MPAPLSEQTRRHDAQHDEARHRGRNHERRRQLRGLLLLAAAVLVFSLLRAHHVFTPGWWRLW